MVLNVSISLAEQIGEVAASEDIIILSDEIYEKIIYNDNEHVSIASISDELKALTITVNGFSKAYSMTGWRVGYAAGPVELIKAMNMIQSQSTTSTSTISGEAPGYAVLTTTTGKSTLGNWSTCSR